MIKLVLLVRRKAGIDRAAFRDYYESTHAPLAASLMVKCKKYVRNFVSEEISGPLAFDVMTEFWFDTAGPWAEARTALTNPETVVTLEADEARFMDRSSMQVFVVDAQESAPHLLQGNGES